MEHAVDLPEREQILATIRSLGSKLARTPSVREFLAENGQSERHLHDHFDTWNDAVIAAGLAPNDAHARLEPENLLADWGRVVRELRRIPTGVQYRRMGQYSDKSYRRQFGGLSAVPDCFRTFAASKSEWADVLGLLPEVPKTRSSSTMERGTAPTSPQQGVRHSKLNDRPTYGNPIDFRGLRHEPVNEQGVVFLFGMVARELGYHVEAVQQGFPDCEAKRQVREGSWQRVRIEFEFESRNFRDHGHAVDGADIIVCWRHNWPELPTTLEVVELSSVLRSLGSADE